MNGKRMIYVSSKANYCPLLCQGGESLVFRHRKAYAPKHADGPSKEIYRYILSDDLTSPTVSKM
jgi:hypothetical protein